MDVKEHEMWPRGIRIHHEVPDMLHPQLVPTTPRVLLWPAQPPRACWKNWGAKVPPGTKRSLLPRANWCLLALLFNESHVLPAPAA